MRILLLFILCSLALPSCDSKRNLTLEELKGYPLNPRNGLRQTVEKEGVTLEMIYRPKDLIIAQQVESNSLQQWNEVKAKLDSLDYFIFGLSKNGKEIQNSYLKDEIKYNEVVNYLSENISQDLELVSGKDTINLEGLVFVPNFGLSNMSSIMLVFPSNLLNQNRDFSILFKDAMFKTGQTEFNFEIKSLKNIPGLIRN